MVFWEKGFQRTSVGDLVNATGLQRGSLYGAFGDKRGVFHAALDAYTKMALERFHGFVTQADDPVDGLKAFIRSGGEDALTGPMRVRGCMVGNACSELVAHDEQARERVTAFVEQMRQRMADALRAGQARGSFPKERDPYIVATYLQSSMQGLASLASAAPERRIIEGVVYEILRSLD